MLYFFSLLSFLPSFWMQRFFFSHKGSHTQRGSIEIPSLIICPSVQHDTRVQYAVSARLSKSVWPANQSIPVTHYTMSQQYVTPPPCSTGVNVGRRGNGDGFAHIFNWINYYIASLRRHHLEEMFQDEYHHKKEYELGWDGMGKHSIRNIYIYIYILHYGVCVYTSRACVRGSVGARTSTLGYLGNHSQPKPKSPCLIL